MFLLDQPTVPAELLLTGEKHLGKAQLLGMSLRLLMAQFDFCLDWKCRMKGSASRKTGCGVHALDARWTVLHPKNFIVWAAYWSKVFPKDHNQFKLSITTKAAARNLALKHFALFCTNCYFPEDNQLSLACKQKDLLTCHYIYFLQYILSFLLFRSTHYLHIYAIT